MTKFKITETGEYCLRNGELYTVVGIIPEEKRDGDPFCILGFKGKLHYGISYIYMHREDGTSGRKASEKSEFDIVGKWAEPEVKEHWRLVNNKGEFVGKPLWFKPTLNNTTKSIIGYIKTRLTINPDGTKDIKIIKQEWK